MSSSPELDPTVKRIVVASSISDSIGGLIQIEMDSKPVIRMDLRLSLVLALITTGLFPALAMYTWSTRPLGYTEEGAVDLALHFLRNAPTFRFDGVIDSLRVERVETLRMPWTWEVTIAFKCRHAGYGDRTGEVLSQVVTPHMIKVAVSKGRVMRAVIDERWDELNQRMIM